MDPFVDQNEIVLLDVHYSTRTMVKFRTDVVFGILDLIAAFGGSKEHREQIIVSKSRLSFQELLDYF